jgi:hypothetical protein
VYCQVAQVPSMNGDNNLVPQRQTPRDSQIHNKIHTGSGMTKGKRQCQIVIKRNLDA